MTNKKAIKLNEGNITDAALKCIYEMDYDLYKECAYEIETVGYSAMVDILYDIIEGVVKAHLD